MKSKKSFIIFIVDDDKVFSLALKADIETSFKNMPIEIHVFESGEKCLEKIEQLKPHVVILDFYMNSVNAHAMDGLKVLGIIKKESPDTNVIMLTKNDNLEIAVKAMQHGASDYVVKTETQFKKINLSLTNIFKLFITERNLKNMKKFIFFIVLFLFIIIGIVIALQIYRPDLLNR